MLTLKIIWRFAISRQFWKSFFNHINNYKDSNIHRDFVSSELVGFYWYSIDVENCKCALYWWHKEQNKFPTLVILVRHILGIPINQIETKRIFYVARILTTFRKWHLQMKNMDKLTLSIKTSHLICGLVVWNPLTLHLHVR
jgi:hypothetical protein